MSATPVMFLGIATFPRALYVVTSHGQRTTVSGEAARGPAEWLELATYGLSIPEGTGQRALRACVAIPSGTTPPQQQALADAARSAGWDALLLVRSLEAAQRALPQEQRQRPALALLVVDADKTSVGLVRTGRGAPLIDDAVRPIPGREAREAAVSLRCLLKSRPRAEAREALREVIVTGDPEELERIGQRHYERELRSIGAEAVRFELDPFLIAEGSALLAAESESGAWRQFRRSG